MRAQEHQGKCLAQRTPAAFSMLSARTGGLAAMRALAGKGPSPLWVAEFYWSSARCVAVGLSPGRRSLIKNQHICQTLG